MYVTLMIIKKKYCAKAPGFRCGVIEAVALLGYTRCRAVFDYKHVVKIMFHLQKTDRLSRNVDKQLSNYAALYPTTEKTSQIILLIITIITTKHYLKYWSMIIGVY
jgi:hypothetical protein